MYVRQAAILGVRGFGISPTDRRFALDLIGPGWTVIAGRNGSGKTTLLQAIAAALAGPGLAQELLRDSRGWVRNGCSHALVSLLVDYDDSDSFSERLQDPWLNSERQVAPGLSWQRVPGDSAGYPGVIRPNVQGDPLRLLADGLWFGDVLAPASVKVKPDPPPEHKSTPQGWLAVGYGAERMIAGSSVLLRGVRQAGRNERIAGLFRKGTLLDAGFDWLREWNYRKLEGKPGAERVERSLLLMLNSGLLPEGVRIEGVDSDGAWIGEGEHRLRLRDAAAGYQVVTGLVLDLMMQVHAAFGALEVDESAGIPRVMNSGVVLIDEIEVQLHPAWQQRIGFWLKEHFPRIQFLVSTHSPFVCQAADPGGIIRLPAPGEAAPARTLTDDEYHLVANGSADDAVMSVLFGLDHPHSLASEKLREEVADLEARALDGVATEDEARRLEALVEQLPAGPSAETQRSARALSKP